MDTEDDEGIIRQRLLAKETVLKRLTKRYLSFCNALQNMPHEACTEACENLIKEIALYQISLIDKTLLIYETNQDQIEKYAFQYKAKEEEIEKVKREIAKLEIELEMERLNRKHREEYNNLCSLIFSLPSRTVSLAHIHSLNEELEILSQQILLHAAHQLQHSLEEEQKEELKKQNALLNAPSEIDNKKVEEKKEELADKMEEGRIIEEEKLEDNDKNESREEMEIDALDADSELNPRRALKEDDDEEKDD